MYEHNRTNMGESNIADTDGALRIDEGSGTGSREQRTVSQTCSFVLCCHGELKQHEMWNTSHRITGSKLGLEIPVFFLPIALIFIL